MVVVVLAILATLTVPRISGNEKRQFRLAVDQVGDLLTMYAQRQNLGQKVVGLLHDRSRNWIQLVVLDTEGSATDHVSSWRIDPHVEPVKLPRFIQETDVAIFENGDAIDATEYPLSSEIGQERPNIEITLRGAGEYATLLLSPYGVSPTLTSSFGGTGVVREKSDLDAAGRNREDW